MSEQPIRVLLLDDEESLRKPLTDYLHNAHGFIVNATGEGNEALRLVEEAQGRYDVALVDEVLAEPPGGLEVLKEIKARYSDIEVILFTGWGRQAGIEALRAGASRYLTKPFDKDELALFIRFAAEQKRLRREHDYMAALVKTSQALAQKTNLDEQLILVWDFVREQLATPTCFVALYDPQEDKLRFPLSYDEGKPDPVSEVVLGKDPSNWGLAGYVIKTGQEQVWFTREQKEKDWQNLGIKSRLSGMGPSESGICLPLRVMDTILGAFSVQSYSPYAFDQALLNAVRALGSQIAVALENSRLMNEKEQKARNLQALQDLTIAINSTLDLKEVLTRTCQAAVELSGADHSGLLLFDPDLGQGEVIAEYPPTDTTVGRIIPVRGVPAEERLVFEQEPLNIPDVASETSLGLVRDLLLQSGIRSIMIVPVIFDGKVVASFSLDALEKPRTFSQSEIEICQSLANQVAVAIRNVRLFKETDEGREYLRSLYQATSKIIAQHDPNEVLQHIVDTACRTTGAWRAAALLVDESNRPRILAHSGFEFQMEAATSVREEGISRQVIKSGEARFIPDTEAESDQIHPAMLQQGVKAAACVPLPLMGRNIGVLWIHFHEKHAFSKTEKQALQLYANQSAIAYDNARRMRELVQLQKAAEAMAREEEWKEVLKQIAHSAKQVLDADCALIWPYDAERGEEGIFFPEDLVAEGIPDDLLAEFRNSEPDPGSITKRVLEDGYIKVESLDGAQAEFVREKTRGFLNKLAVKSFQGIRLDVANEPLGVLFVDYKHARGFGNEDRTILEHFANHAALTLKKARLHEQVRRSQEAARTIAKASTLGDLDRILKATVEGAREVLHCDISTLYTFDEEKKRFMRMAGVGCRDEKNMRPPDEITPSSSLWRIINLPGDKNYHLSEDALNDDRLKGGFVRQEGVKSALGIRLRVEAERVGVMFVNYCTPHRFTQDEIKDALHFGHQAAAAIRNAQLNERTMRQANALDGLYKASEAVTGVLTLEEILNSIARQAWHLAGPYAYYTSIRLVEGNIAKAVSAYPPEELAQTLTTIPEIDLTKGVDGRIGVTGRAIRTGVAQLVDDVSRDTDYLPSHPQTRSELAVPIKRGEQVIGVINVESREPQVFNESDNHALESLAGYAAIAINTAKQTKTLKGLYEASKAITSSLALEEVLTRIAEHALNIVGANPQEGCFSHIALLDGNKLRFIAGFPLEILDDLRQNLGEIDLEKDARKGIVGRVVRERNSQNVAEVVGDPHWIPLREGINIHSQLSAPLKIGERIIGVLSIEHPTPAAFSDEDVRNIELLAAQAAVAIENARLYNAAEQRAKNLHAVLNVSQTSISSLDLTQILNATCQASVELLNVDHSGLVLFDQDLVSGKVYAEHPEIGTVGVEFPLHGVPAEERLIATKKPLMVPDVANELGFEPVRELLTKLGTCLILIVPIVSKGQILGSLGLDVMKSRRVFTEEEKELCQIFAAQVAVAIENARRYEDLRTMKALVGTRTATEWMKMVSYAWGHAIKRETGLALRYIALIRQDWENGNSSQANQDLSRLADVIERIKDIPIVAPLAEGDRVMHVAINGLLRRHVDRLWQHEPYKSTVLSWNLQSDLDDLAVVVASPQWVLRAIEIFLSNSIEAMMEANTSTRQVEIATQISGNMLEILVKDSGPGFPPQMPIEKIGIEPVYKPEGSHGAGVGLVLAKLIAQTYGGDIRAVDTRGTGAIIVMSLPYIRI
jgi:GAF domain-containing protein/ActR/RegA family two-component response regulator